MDKPNRSKQQTIAELTHHSGVGIQKLTFNHGQFISRYVDGTYSFADIENTIAKDDGLKFDDLKA